MLGVIVFTLVRMCISSIVAVGSIHNKAISLAMLPPTQQTKKTTTDFISFNPRGDLPSSLFVGCDAPTAPRNFLLWEQQKKKKG